MTLTKRALAAAKRAAQKGFTLIELAIVGLFLGLLAIFAISQFSGSATDTTRANAMFEASTKIADSWALLVQNCGIGNDITTTNISGTSASDPTGIAAANLDVLLGNATPGATYTACYASSGVRPLTGLSVGGAGAEQILAHAVVAGTQKINDRTALALTFKATPESQILPLYNKYASVSTAATAATVPTSASTDNVIQFPAGAAGSARDLTIVKVL